MSLLISWNGTGAGLFVELLSMAILLVIAGIWARGARSPDLDNPLNLSLLVGILVFISLLGTALDAIDGKTTGWREALYTLLSLNVSTLLLIVFSWLLRLIVVSYRAVRIYCDPNWKMIGTPILHAWYLARKGTLSYWLGAGRDYWDRVEQFAASDLKEK